MKHLFTRSLLALATSAANTALMASPLEEIVITSSRVAMPLRETGTSISVVNQDAVSYTHLTLPTN